MKISLRWLNDYVDVADFFAAPEKLAEILTHSGLEIESLENLGQRFNHVVVGHIIEKGQHPDADRLSLCKVDIGTGEIQQIVCGASNHKQGDKVVAALPGAVLPGDFAIKKSKIRGVESNGMLCSEVELGLEKESAGIMILPADAPVGKSFAEYYGMDDVLFEIKVTPNRADCLSHFGLAREIGCLLDRPVEFPVQSFEVGSESTEKYMKLKVTEPELCPRYAGRAIRGVKIGESPLWLKRRLELIGLNSINNVVDVTNFVMMELGQPLHAFDSDQIAGATILVGLAREGEKFISLDGSEIELKGDELMIRDAEQPVALAGVVGGVNSGVTEDTRNLFIESAYFTMATVRRTARKLGIETDSAYRFSRGVDPEGTVLAMNRACQLIQEVAGGDILGAPYDFYPAKVSRPSIEISLSFVAQKLGYEIQAQDFSRWMKRLGCQVQERNGVFSVQAPPYRGDLTIAEDLVEEFARLNGYEKIPEVLPVLATEPADHTPEFSLFNRMHSYLQGAGFQQAVNFSFVDPKLQAELIGDVSKLKELNLDAGGEVVPLMNPLSEDLGVMRTLLSPGLLKTAAFNDRHGNSVGQIYEIGFSFANGTDGEYIQRSRLCLAMWGEPLQLWKQDVPLVYRLKSEIELLLGHLKSSSWKWLGIPMDRVPDFLHPGQASSLFYEGKTVGFVGTLHPHRLEQMKMKRTCAVAEFNLELLLKGQPRLPKAKTPSKFPGVERDLAFVMPKSLPAGDVMAEIRKVAGQTLKSVNVFDVYEGGPLADGQRSVAFRLNYQGSNETLSDDQILDLQQRVINSVSQKFSISVR